jgi:antitoxin (DNA-binding transcriptional repressor) of toxin-antitoxin stability system
MEKTTTATRLRVDFSDILRNLHTGPVEITKHGKVVAVLAAPKESHTQAPPPTVEVSTPIDIGAIPENEGDDNLPDCDDNSGSTDTGDDNLSDCDDNSESTDTGDDNLSDWFDLPDDNDNFGAKDAPLPSALNDIDDGATEERASEEDWRVALLAARARIAAKQHTIQ